MGYMMKGIKIFYDCLHLPYVEGRVWATDAFLHETAGQVALRQKWDYIVVVMEPAGVQSVCDFMALLCMVLL